MPLPAVVSLILQADVHAVTRRRPVLIAFVFQQRRLRRVEHETHRVQRHDRRQHGGFGGDEIPRGEPVIGRLPVERRDDLRELEIEGVGVDAGLSRSDIRARLLLGGKQGIEVRLAEDVIGDECLAPLELRLCVHQGRARPRQLRP